MGCQFAAGGVPPAGCYARRLGYLPGSPLLVELWELVEGYASVRDTEGDSKVRPPGSPCQQLLCLLMMSWSRVGVVPGSEAGGDGGVGGDATTPAQSWASSGAAVLARTDSTDSVSASMTGGGAAELTPASVSRAAAVKEATPQPSAPLQGARRKTKPRK
ncbi:hypothetical protein Pcinc_003311 [Petrolisthes cinctipes]|uniref:Uncharacterized protein n=1 Tax=Petrolisthes cinctipes TaxID=88211 RepID=A0AAE1L4S8_PETCI|nr:hypothetical protein Pcinc_003311 [Petrolisthes cinctipes]